MAIGICVLAVLEEGLVHGRPEKASVYSVNSLGPALLSGTVPGMTVSRGRTSVQPGTLSEETSWGRDA